SLSLGLVCPSILALCPSGREMKHLRWPTSLSRLRDDRQGVGIPATNVSAETSRRCSTRTRYGRVSTQSRRLGASDDDRPHRADPFPKSKCHPTIVSNRLPADDDGACAF